MFDEINKYKNNDHFFFKPESKLVELTKNIPDKPGVFYIFRLSRGRVDLIFIGRTGLLSENPENQSLRKELGDSETGKKFQAFFDEKMKKEDVDALDIYWYVTMDKNHQDLPYYTEGLLLQRYFEVFGDIPPWNRDFEKNLFKNLTKSPLHLFPQENLLLF